MRSAPVTNMGVIWNAATYDSERRRLIYCFDEFYGTVGALVVRFCPDSPSILDILDLGAGTGILSAAIVERVPTAKIHLLDASSEMLLQAASRLGKWQPQVTVQSLSKALPEGPFDAVVSALAIHRLDDAEKHDLYSRILATLAPGGICIPCLTPPRRPASGRSDRDCSGDTKNSTDCS